jgi:hypothetical protein
VTAISPDYQRATFRKQKSSIVNQIIETVQRSGGLFLSLEANQLGYIGWVE